MGLRIKAAAQNDTGKFSPPPPWPVLAVSFQVAQRGGRCPIPGNIQHQVGRGSEQPDVVEDVPADGRRGGLDGL